MSRVNTTKGVHNIIIRSLTHFNANELAIVEKLIADLKGKVIQFTIWIRAGLNGGTTEDKRYIALAITGKLNQCFGMNVELKVNHEMFKMVESK